MKFKMKFSKEKDIEYSKKYFEYILDMMPIGLGIRSNVDKDPKVEFENRKLKEMFDKTSEGDEHHWCESGFSKDISRKALVSENSNYSEERTFPNGRVYLFTLSYFKNQNDDWCELQIVQDITDRRKLEDKLQNANKELSRKVEVSIEELREKHDQLSKSEKMAALGNMIFGIAHEINTPLAALNSNNDVFRRTTKKLKSILFDKSISKGIREHPRINMILGNLEKLTSVNSTAAERIIAIVNSLRRYARMDKLEKEDMDVHEGIDNTLTLIHHQIKNRIEVIKNYGELPLLKCYPNKVNQVFMNILVNASQAIESEGKIVINTFLEKGSIMIEFMDTGKGIPADNVNQVFDTGFTTKGSGEGTGLGLAIVKKIVDEHKGKIKVESEVGKGTTFRLKLPVE